MRSMGLWRLGHSTIALALGTYSHVIPALDQDAAKRPSGNLALPDQNNDGKPAAIR